MVQCLAPPLIPSFDSPLATLRADLLSAVVVVTRDTADARLILTGGGVAHVVRGGGAEGVEVTGHIGGVGVRTARASCHLRPGPVGLQHGQRAGDDAAGIGNAPGDKDFCPGALPL